MEPKKGTKILFSIMGFIFGFTLTLVVGLEVGTWILSLFDLEMEVLFFLFFIVFPIVLVLSIRLGIASSAMFLRTLEKQQENKHFKINGYIILLILFLIPILFWGWFSLETYSDSPAYCKRLSTQEEIDNCYANKNQCDKIQSEEIKVYCYTLNYDFTLSNCENIKDLISKDKCYIDYSRIYRDSTACDKIQEIEKKDKCYIDYSRIYRDSTACDKIQEIEKKDTCYYEYTITSYAQYERTPEHYKVVCDKIQEIEKKDDCYIRATTLLIDASYCDKISKSNYDYKFDCYLRYATRSKDVSICESDFFKNNSTYRDKCYYNYATSLGKLEFCENIKDPETKQLCR